jgi:hypothetical protein
MYLRYLIPAFLSSEKMKESVENFFDGSQQKGHKSLQILLERGRRCIMMADVLTASAAGDIGCPG